MAIAEVSTAELIEQAAKLSKYRYLLPQVSPELAAMAQSSVSDQPAAASVSPLEAALAAEGELPPELAVLVPTVWEPLDEAAARDRAVACLLGLAIGDAVGAAVEFKPRGSFPEVKDMIGGGPFNLKPGEWTDDTTMALCLAESLLATGDMDQADFMSRLRNWLENGHNTVPGKCFDIGLTTKAAIEQFIATGEPSQGTGEDDTAGNGSLSRLPPLAIYFAPSPGEAIDQAARQSLCTHATQETLDACRLLTAQLVDALNGAPKDAVLRPRVMNLAPQILFICAGEWKEKSRDQIQSSGYVVHTLEAALWSVGTTNSFKAAVLTAANLGDDADSVAAVAGSLAGALYGTAGIPKEWLGKLAWRDKIESLARQLFGAGRATG